MNLHSDKEAFKEIIALAAEHFSYEQSHVEKDYWVSKILRDISMSEYADKTYFKGGTSLSKAYGLIERFSEDFFAIIPTKSGLMPYAKEVLEYLAPKYNLYILSNGFRELQSRKMRSAGVDIYFKKVILSEDLGVLKPWPEIFNFALSATQSELRESLMIGDSWEADITGAHGIGMHQAFYNVTGRTSFPFQPTYHIYSLKDLIDLL